MLVTNGTADWTLLQDVFYRKVRVYGMAWDVVDMSNFLWSGGRLGGPLASIRRDQKVLALSGTQSTRATLSVTSSNGSRLFSKAWTDERIMGFGWTDAEDLVAVLENGTVHVYDLQGSYRQFQLGFETDDYGVLQARVFGSGLVVLTGNYKFVLVPDTAEPRPRLLEDPGLCCEPESWTVIPPDISLSRHPEVLVATGDTLFLMDATSCIDQRLFDGPFTKMAVSPNGQLLSLFCKDGRLKVLSIDFQTKLAEIATTMTLPPLQMEWCGNDSVVLHWEDTVWVVGPAGDWIKYSYDGTVYLVSEPDGLRIISSGGCDFLQRVPPSIEAVFRIGSTAPAAILFDAKDLYDKKNPKADECIRSIMPELYSAVDSCIDAAGHELDPDIQKQLLRSASFGKCFLDTYPADKFVDMCKTLRVLNAIREPPTGIFLTYGQLQTTSLDAVVTRLMKRNLHLLAFKVATYLDLYYHGVLIHWACYKIRTSSEDDQTLARTVVAKFQEHGQDFFSMADVAKAAHEAGRIKLAIKLLDHEPKAASQVPLLLSMQEDEIALVKAIESGDVDLVYLAMLHMKRQLPLAEFFRLVNDKPVAASLLELYGRQNDLPLLKDFYYQDDRRADGARLLVLEAMDAKEPSEYSDKLKIAAKMFDDDKRHPFESKMTEEQLKLLQAQMALEKDTGQSFSFLPLNETLTKCVLVGQSSKASKIKSDFKVPEKRFWWIQVRVFIQTQNWESLEKFIKTTPRFGLANLVEALLRAGHRPLAQKYVETALKSSSSLAEKASLEELLRRY